MKKETKKLDYEKLAKVMLWEKFEGETYEQVFLRKDIKPSHTPDPYIVDVVSYESLENWAKHGEFKSLEELKSEIIFIFKRAVVDKINNEKSMQKLFPPIYNFCVFATNTDKRGKITAEAEKIAEIAWYGDLAKKRLQEKTDKIFSEKPDPEKYKKVAEKIQKIWGFTDIEIDAFRYFICQTRHEGHNPSMNKSLYLSSNKKKTGKTSIARAIASILNGGKDVIYGAKLETTFGRELQLYNHDLPYAAQYNCAILDEAMPKDSRKSYGLVKSMLTSNTCVYNQKWGRMVQLEAKRYYIYTSNDDISEFVQDSSERRFIQINMERLPLQIDFDEIYDIWKEFAQNCEPEENWQEWYNTFEDVVGIASKDVDYYTDELLSNKSIMESILNNSGYTVTVKFFCDLMFKGKPTREERNTVKSALTKLIGEPNGYRWNKREVEEKLQEKINEQQDKDGVDEYREVMPFDED